MMEGTSIHTYPYPMSKEEKAMCLAIESLEQANLVFLPDNHFFNWIISFIHKNVSVFGRDMDLNILLEVISNSDNREEIYNELKKLENDRLLLIRNGKLYPRERFFTIYPREFYLSKEVNN
jgi:hypothetical protein